jgi:hypothetical protein
MAATAETKTDPSVQPAPARRVSYDEYARALVEKWLAEIRAISAEREMPPLMRP